LVRLTILYTYTHICNMTIRHTPYHHTPYYTRYKTLEYSIVDIERSDYLLIDT